MAYTASIIKNSTFGDMRVVMISCTADGVSGVIVTGLAKVFGMSVTPVSSASFSLSKFHRNVNAASATANGSIMASSCANGDDFFIVAYGV